MTQQRPFILIAHRGVSAEAPENTLAAFDKALEQGFPHIELDVQLTRDGHVVVIHDTTLERTTNGSGPLAGHTLEALGRLDAGSWFSTTFRGEHIPTLAEVLRWYRGRAFLHLEMKSLEPELPVRVSELLREHGWYNVPRLQPGDPWAGPFILTSFDKAQLDRVRLLLPSAPLAWLVEEVTPSLVDTCVASGIAMLCPHARSVTREAVALSRERRLRVRTWGVATEEGLLNAYHAGAEGTTVNWPRRAREVLRGLEPGES
ncbi:MAG: hypothetical protein HY532_02890 [Chloroflexi bacterium]|nr:hypothetical protein [Chloroflexota bacterium]